MTGRYDVVVVGAGVAGCVVASRITPEQRVLVLEAGCDFRSATLPPTLRYGGFLQATRLAQTRWDGLTARRSQPQRFKPFLQGKGVGGTSLINGQIMLRPAAADFDGWATGGCAGWSYQDVLPSLAAIESDADFGHRPGHGDDGPVPIRRTPRTDWDALDQGLAEWATGRGLPYRPDHNAHLPPTGVSPYAYCDRDGARVTAADAFLEGVRGTQNLEVHAEAFAEKIVVREGRVAGLTVVAGGIPEFIATDMVVVTAGAIQSPALLLRSGIGPADELREAGVEVVCDLPGVGRGLQDHPAITVPFEYGREGTAHRATRATNVCVQFDAGLPGSSEGELFVNALDTVAEHEGGQRIGAIVLALFRPESRGSVRLQDPYASPVVDLNLLSSESDVRRLSAGIDAVRDLVEHPALRAIGAPFRAVGGTSGLAGWLRRHCHEAWHLAGTCRMGDPAAADTVVDPGCQVLGVEGLLVMDVSVLPTVPRANTALVTMALAHHATT